MNGHRSQEVSPFQQPCRAPLVPFARPTDTAPWLKKMSTMGRQSKWSRSSQTISGPALTNNLQCLLQLHNMEDQVRSGSGRPHLTRLTDKHRISYIFYGTFFVFCGCNILESIQVVQGKRRPSSPVLLLDIMRKSWTLNVTK